MTVDGSVDWAWVYFQAAQYVIQALIQLAEQRLVPFGWLAWLWYGVCIVSKPVMLSPGVLPEGLAGLLTARQQREALFLTAISI